MSMPGIGLNDAERGAGLLDSPRWAGHNTFTIPEVAEILRISRWSAYEAAKRKELPTIWIGKRCFVPRRALERLLGVDEDVPANGQQVLRVVDVPSVPLAPAPQRVELAIEVSTTAPHSRGSARKQTVVTSRPALPSSKRLVDGR